MFCPNCGTENQDDSVFCESCGQRLDLPDNFGTDIRKENVNVAEPIPVYENNREPSLGVHISPVPYSSPSPKGGLRKHMKIILPVLILLVLIIGFYCIGSSMSDPEKFVQNYVDELVSGDFQGAFDYMSFTETDFINSTSFEAYMENSSINYSEISHYVINKKSTTTSLSDLYDSDEDNSLVKNYTVTYILNGSSVEKSFDVSLVKQKDNFLLFFDNYKVATDDMTSEVTFYVPSGATLYFDDLELNESCNEYIGVTEPESNYYNYVGIPLPTYYISSVFKGIHNVYVEHPSCEAYEMDIDTSTGNFFLVQTMYLSDDTMDALAAKTEEIVKIITAGAIAGDEFDSLEMDCTTDRESLNNIKASYADIASSLEKDTGEGLVSIDFKSFIDRSNTYTVDCDMTYQCSVSFAYDYKGRYRVSGSSTNMKEQSGSNTGNAAITYAYENGQWVVKSIDSFAIYY